MAVIFLDGFDKYGPAGETSPTLNTLILHEWTTLQGGNISIGVTTGLSSTGQAIQFNGGASNTNWFEKTFPTNYSRIIGGFRYSANLANGNNCGISFRDGAAFQFAITLNTTGGLSLRSGNVTGTALGTSTVTYSANSTHYLEWDVTLGAAGAYNVYVDGVLIITGTGNTRLGSGVSQTNGISLGNITNNNGSTWICDDLYLLDTSGSFNNSVLLTSPRIETRRPTSDTQTQFTNAGNVIVPGGQLMTGVSTVTASTFGPGANFLTLMQITPSVNCTLQSVATTAQTTNGTAKFKAVLYADSAGAPGALTATGTETTGSTSGSALTMPFGSGQALTASTSYWIGYINDSAVNISEYNTTPTSGTGASQRKANTYASGPPSPAGGSFTAGAPAQIWGVATGAATNFASVTCNPANGTGSAADSGSITSSTAGNEDLYGFPALSTTANLVYAIAVKGHMKRSDSGTRTVDLRMKSSATDSAGSTAGQTPGTTYTWIDSYFDSDPNGSIAWTGTSANAATAGPKINS